MISSTERSFQGASCSIQKCLELYETYNPTSIFGRYSAEVSDFVFQWNRRQMHEILITQAPHVQPDGSIYFHINLLLDAFTRGILHLPEGSILRGYLQEFQSADLPSVSDVKHPPLAALCYAVAPLLEISPEDMEYEEDAEAGYRFGADEVTGY